MIKRFIPFGEPLIDKEEIDAIGKVIKSGWIGMGPEVEKFEEEFAQYTGAKYAVAVNSCTSGLHLSLIVNGIGRDDEVILPSMTFAATANVIEHVGAKPIFAEIDPITFNIDPEDIKRKITKKTKAIMPVHFGGLACDMQEINKISQKHSLKIIEDAAHALGTIHNGKKIGSGDNLTSFSFYPNKTITTIEGGMITLSSAKITDELKVLRLQGLSQHAWQRFKVKKLIHSKVFSAGYKYNLTDVSAAMGRVQLKKIEKFIEKKITYTKMADQVLNYLPDVQLQIKPLSEKERHAIHIYLIVINPKKFSLNRDEIVAKLREENIGAGIHYIGVHMHPYYKEKYGKISLPITEYLSSGVLSLPMTPKITPEEMEEIIHTTKNILEKYHR